MALTTGGTVWTWGDEEELGNGSTADSTVPVQVPGLAGITQVAAGLGFDLALRSDGTVWGWGLNTFGQLGDGNTGLREDAGSGNRADRGDPDRRRERFQPGAALGRHRLGLGLEP